MRFLKTGILAGLICLLGILINLKWMQRAEWNSRSSPSAQSLGDQTAPSSPEPLNQIPPQTKPSSLVASPYSRITVAEIYAAQAKGESWASNYKIADTWALQLTPETDPGLLAERLGGKYVEAVSAFPDLFVFRFTGSDDLQVSGQIQSLIETSEEVLWFQQEILQTFALRYDETPPPILDPLLPDQWHLKNKGTRAHVSGEDANLYPAWNQNVSGAGIHIAIVDTGIEGGHPDLAPNYRNDVDFDYLDNDNSADPQANDETHGTAVAGVAAAAANQSCGIGAAFNAELIGVRLIQENEGVSSSRQASAVSHKSDIVDIYNNSWGPNTDGGANMSGPDSLSFSAIKNAVEQGRNGLGCIYIWAAGNGRAIGSNVNYDGWASMRYSIAVGAVGDQGKLSGYSEPGASMLICAPSSGDTSGIRTTDLSGQNGVDPTDCRIDFGGTSSASPLVAGIVALMLEANPELSWRDVQLILARTAVKVARNHSDWKRNAAGYWVNHNFGFGRVDAAAAVVAAKNWQPVSKEIEIDSGKLPIDQTVPDNSTTGLTVTHVENSKIRIQHVSVSLDLDEAPDDTMNWGNINLILTSPGGTESILAQPHTDAKKTYPDWTYWTVRCLDEYSDGTWTLKIEDRISGSVHVAKSWQLKIYGTEVKETDNHPPIATDDTFTITEATTYLDVLANDSDEDGDVLEIISIYKSPKSSIVLNASGLIEYTPGKGLGGTDKFAYTVHDGRGGIRTAEVSLVIPRPEANPDQVGTLKNTPIIIPVLANDIDYDNDPLRVIDPSQPKHGNVELLENYSISYMPEEGFSGVDRFTYTLTDDDDGISKAEVTVFVTEERDYALRFDGKDDQIVLSNSLSSIQDTAFTIEAWIRPEDWGEGETGYGRILDSGEVVFYIHGTGFPDYNVESLLISLDHSNGSRSIYNTPAKSIRLNEWQHVAVTYDNASQVHLLINGMDQTLRIPFDPASGPVAAGAQQIIIGEATTTQRAFQGAMDEFRIWNRVRSVGEILNGLHVPLSGNEDGLHIYLPMNEGIGSTTGDLSGSARNGTIHEATWIKGIMGSNTAPQVSSDEVSTVIGERLVIPVTQNDSDPDGDELRVSSIVSVSTGTASFLGGSIIYQPPEGFTGTVRIDYVVEDGYNGKTTASLFILIGEGLNYSLWQSSNFEGSLGARDGDIDFDLVTNFSEYAFGTNPLSGSMDPELWNIQHDPSTGKTLFTFTLLKNSLDVSYRLLQTTNLIEWSVPVEGLDYQTLSVIASSPDTETRTLVFFPEKKSPVFVKVEALSLVDSQ